MKKSNNNFKNIYVVKERDLMKAKYIYTLTKNYLRINFKKKCTSPMWKNSRTFKGHKEVFYIWKNLTTFLETLHITEKLNLSKLIYNISIPIKIPTVFCWCFCLDWLTRQDDSKNIWKVSKYKLSLKTVINHNISCY